MHRSRLPTVVALTLTALAACSAAGDERVCPAIGIRKGVGITIDAAIASRVDTAELTVCWAGVCQTEPVVLQPRTRTVDDGCTGGGPDAVCAGRAVPTGDKLGFVDVPELPSSTVEVTVTLTDSAGAPVVEQTVRLAPSMVDAPDGCGSSTPQGQITVGADGGVRTGG